MRGMLHARLMSSSMERWKLMFYEALYACVPFTSFNIDCMAAHPIYNVFLFSQTILRASVENHGGRGNIIPAMIHVRSSI